MKRTGVFALGLVGLLISQSATAGSFEALVKRLSKGADGIKNKKVAVLAFPYHDGRVSSGSSVVSERLTTQLVGKRGIRVVERRLIEQLLSEKKLSETGIVSQENLKTIGSVLDVDAIVTGTLIDLTNGRTEINARMIRADSGELLSAGQDSIERTWKDIPVMPKKATMEVPAPPPQRAPVVETSAPAPVVTEPARKGATMRLSNESFPLSRRIYHGNEKPHPKKKPVHPDFYQYKEEGNYEDGYADAYRDAMMQRPKQKPVEENKTPERALQHPTELGVVRPDGWDYRRK